MSLSFTFMSISFVRTTLRLVDDSDPKIRDAACATIAAVANASR